MNKKTKIRRIAGIGGSILMLFLLITSKNLLIYFVSWVGLFIGIILTIFSFIKQKD